MPDCAPVNTLLELARLAAPAAVLTLAVGCDRLELSDAGQYWLDTNLTQRVTERGGRVLVGSEFGISIHSLAVEGELDEDLSLACVPQTALGVLDELDDERFRVSAVGPGTVEFAAPAGACPDSEVLAALEPDSWSMVGVDADGLAARWMPVSDTHVLATRASPGAAGSFPDMLGRPLTQLRVVDDAPFEAVAMLVDPALGERAEVRYSNAQARVEVPAHYADLLEPPEGGDRNELDGSLHAGESFTATLNLLDHAFALGEVSAVPVEHIEQLELVPFYLPSTAPEREWGPPAGVLALAHDIDGERIVNPPLEWQVTRGRLTAEPYSPELYAIGQICRKARAPEHRSATIEARIDDLGAEIELEWIALPSDEVGEPEDCPHGGCSCAPSSAPAEHGALALLGLGLLGLLRRAQSSRRSADSTPLR